MARWETVEVRIPRCQGDDAITVRLGARAIEIRPGCGEHDHRGAAEAFARYIAAKYTLARHAAARRANRVSRGLAEEAQ